MTEKIVCGFLDSIDSAGIKGWAADPETPASPYRMKLVIDGAVSITVVCNNDRSDVAARGFPSGSTGFFCEIPAAYCDNAEHIIEFFDEGGASINRADFQILDEAILALPQGHWTSKFIISAKDEKRKRRLRRIFDAPHAGRAESLNSDATIPDSGASLEKRDSSQETAANNRLSAAEAMSLLGASGLFLRDWYLETYPDIAEAGVNPLEHFYLWGFSSGRRPNPYFDPTWYMIEHNISIDNYENPLLHYFLFGEQRGLRPIIYFDPAYYRERYSIPEGASCLAHYLSNRFTGEYSPVLEFDAKFYGAQYPDVLAAKVDLFDHYVNYGYLEYRNPSAEFDTRFYRERYLRNSNDSPLIHYLKCKGRPGIHPSMPESESTVSRQIKRFASQGPLFEERVALAEETPKVVKALAYYLTQFHPFAENDEWWGKGFTEWTNVARGSPRFIGHYQPRIPRDLGFYSLTDKEVIRQQIRMAKEAGLFGFVYYYYWFNSHRLMERPLNAFLDDQSLDFPFCLMWANENWTRRWDGADAEVLISQDYRDDDNERLIDAFGAAFRDPRYIRLEGRPLLMLYRPGIVPNCKESVERWRILFMERCGEHPIIIMSQSFNDLDPTQYGLDGAIEFPPHKVVSNLPLVNTDLTYLDPDFTAQVYSYDDVVKTSLSEKAPPFPLIKTACPSWDNDARRQGAGLVIHGSTPSKFQGWLEGLSEKCQTSRFFGEPVICINAWNEWAEGTYLEPDLHFGSAYLNAASRAIAGLRSSKNNGKVLLVGHDAFPSGAQQLLLNIGRKFVSMFGLEVSFLLLDGGRLERDYKKVAVTKVSAIGADLDEYLTGLRDRGYSKAIVNTSAAASVCKSLSAAGFASTLLVHELPRIISEKQLAESVRIGLEFADQCVFAADFVRDEFLKLSDRRPRHEVILAQGSYKSVSFSQTKRKDLRSQLGVSGGEFVAIGVGYADLRKGYDLFLQTWRTLRHLGSGVHFWWVGSIDPTLENYLSAEIASAEATGTFHMLGFRDDVGDLMSASDVFVLTSREDPYPTVALEAISAGLPCVAFKGTGGIPETILKHSAGSLVEIGDITSLSEAILSLLKRSKKLVQSERSRLSGLAKEEFSFDRYSRELKLLVLPELISISAVVPNYNYAHYLPGRLRTIFRQTYPVQEVLVLDDCSTDESVAVATQVAIDEAREITIVKNDKNSGSVFRQWRKAAETATGDYVWIAEADDESDPKFLEELVAAVKRHGNVVFVFADSRAIDGDGKLLWPDHKAYFASAGAHALASDGCYSGREFVKRFLSERNLILNVSCALWKRDTLVDAMRKCEGQLLTYRMAGDWHLYVELMTAVDCNVAFVAQPLNVHRRHAASVTHALAANRHLEEIERIHQLVQERTDSEELAEKQSRYIAEVAQQLGVSRGGA
jgi:glycosyltransferase involved in cell wall biosynthesis